MAVPLKVLVTHNTEDREAYYGRARPELEAIRGIEVVLNPTDRDLTTTELIEAADGCQVIVAHRSTAGEAPLFARCPELVAFLRCAVDISTIDVAAADEHGVLVARADKSFIASTAELALGLLLAVLRNIGESTIDYRDGRQPPQRPGRQLRGMTVGIIGYGSIGAYLTEVFLALGVNVLVTDPEVQAPAADDPHLRQVELHELLTRSDAVFPLAPAQPSTANLIDGDALAAMKPGAILINVSRGELVDERAVEAALDSGHLGGLGLDVGRAADQRPSPSLANRPGVVATPHLGGLTPENADAQAASSVEQVEAISRIEIPPRSVNAEHARRLRAYWTAQQR